MIDNLQKAIYQNLSELFASATLDEMAGDFPAFKKKLQSIAQIAEILGVDTEIIAISINIKTGDTTIEYVEPEPGADNGTICSELLIV